MGDKTAIEWADSTLGLWIGCTRVSPACDHCYAADWGRRFGIVWDAPPVKTADSTWAKIAGYQRSADRFRKKHGRDRRVFINSLSDFFDNQAKSEWREKACREMEAAPDVIWILVTKRPQNVSRFVPAHWLRAGGWPTNIWLVVTAENQVEYDRRVAAALTIPGLPWTGISMEPMLAPIHPGASISLSSYERAAWAAQILKKPFDWNVVNEIGWTIVGGESGSKARPMPDQRIVEKAVALLRSAGRPVFMKQLSQAEHPATYGDFETFPRNIRFREHPKHV